MGKSKATFCFRFKVNKVPVVGTTSDFGFLLCWCLKRRLYEEGVLLICLGWVKAMVRERVENIEVNERKLVRSQESFVD